MDTYRYTQSQFDAAIDKLAAKIQLSSFCPHCIVAPVRGGLVPGVYLSHRLSVPLIPFEPLGLRHRTPGHVLVVDDIADSGATLQQVTSSLRGAGFVRELLIATLVYRKGASVVPDFYDLQLTTKEWVVFPWEPQDA